MAPGRLTIDVGSTECRSVIVYRDRHKIRKRVVENREEADSSTGEVNYHSSKALVHDDRQPRYAGHAIQFDREESSVKFFAYILVNKNQKFIDQYPLLARLWLERGKVGEAEFDARLEDAFMQFLRAVFKSIKATHELLKLGGEPVPIGTLVLTMPSQWGIAFGVVYKRLFLQGMREVYADRPDLIANDIVVEFYTEAQALAHYIFHKALRKRLGGGMPAIEEILRLSKTNAQLLIDCGGHNANSTLTTFFRSVDGSGTLVELTSPRGAGGGGEMMMYHLIEKLIAQYRQEYHDPHSPITQEFYQNLKRHTKVFLREIVDGATHTILVPGNHLQSGRPISLEITSDMCKETFETGFKHVMEMVQEQLNELVNIKSKFEDKEHIVTIIVSGGSARHPRFLRWIRRLCASLGVGEPIFTSQMDIAYGASRIATGAGYASVTTPSIESFGEKCAFGVQKCNVMEDGNLDREDYATTIWTKERGTVRVDVVANGDLAEYRIVCQPLLDSFTHRLLTDRGSVGSECYDLLIIGTLPNCLKCEFEFKLDIEKKEITLVIICHPFSSARTAAAKEPTKIQIGPFGVHIQASTRNLLLDLTQEEVAERVDEVIKPYQDGTTYQGLDAGGSSDGGGYVNQDGSDSDGSSVEDEDDDSSPSDDDDPSGDDNPLGDANHVDDENPFGHDNHFGHDDSSDDDDPFDNNNDQPGSSRGSARIDATSSRSRPTASIAARGMNEAPATGSSATTERASDGAPGPSFRVAGPPRHNLSDSVDDGDPGTFYDLGDFPQGSPPPSGSHEGGGAQSHNQADDHPEVQTTKKKKRGLGAKRSANRFLANLADELFGSGAMNSAADTEGGQDNRSNLNDASVHGQASSGPSTATASQAAGGHGNAFTRNKRGAHAQPDNARWRKRPCRRLGQSGSASVNGGTGQNGFPGGSRGTRGTGQSNNQSSSFQRAGPPPPQANQRPPRTWVNRIRDDLSTPSRRSGGSSSAHYPDTYFGTGRRSAAAQGDTSTPDNVVHIPPHPLPQRPVDSNATPRNGQMAHGHSMFGSLPIRSPSPAPSLGSPFGPNSAAPGSASSEAARASFRPGNARAPRTAAEAFAAWNADPQASRWTDFRSPRPQNSQASERQDTRTSQRSESDSARNPGQEGSSQSQPRGPRGTGRRQPPRHPE